MGRPTVYTPELAEKVCAALAETGSLSKACARPGMPSRRTVARWIVDNTDGFVTPYARAKAEGIDRLVEQTLEIADFKTRKKGGMTAVDVSHAKLRIDTRLWIAERMEARKYGVRQAIDVSNPDGSLSSDPRKRAARMAQIMAEAARRKAAAGGDDDVDS